MIGNNKLKLNQSSMMQAVQMWLDSKTVHSIGKVTAIEWEGNTAWFSVSITSPDKPEEQP